MIGLLVSNNSIRLSGQGNVFEMQIVTGNVFEMQIVSRNDALYIETNVIE